MSRITVQTISQIFDTARIEEVIGDFVQLKRSGSNLKGLSPFTNEKTASFYVSPAKQIFKCFSSNKGGTVVSFLMEYENLSYPEALRYLAKRYGIQVEEEEQSEEEQKETSLRESLFIVQEFAKDFYVNYLWHTEKGRAIGLSYLSERGFSSETIQKFNLGFSPEGRTDFSEAALKKGYDRSVLIQAGLVRETETYSSDLFRDRIMFPIHSLSGRVVGFGGRILKNNPKAPKYVNSPETEIYHKGKLLYGLFQARKSVVKADHCLVVEGYTDVISMVQSGIENVVSTSGTALTSDQIRLIKRLTENIVFLFDGDAAGIRASLRGIDLVLKEGMQVKIVLLPDNHDPDSFAKAYGQEGIRKYIGENEKDFIRFRCDLILEDAKDDPIAKTKLIGELLDSIALIPNAISRSLYVQMAARETKMDEALLLRELNAAIDRHARNEQKEFQRQREREKHLAANQEPDSASTSTGLAALPASTPETALIELEEPPGYRIEKAIVELLLNHGYKKITASDKVIEEDVSSEAQELTVTQFILQELAYNEVSFKDPICAGILNRIHEAWLKGRDVLTAEDFLESQDGSAELVADLLFEKFKISNWEEKGVYVRNRDESLSQYASDVILRLLDILLYEKYGKEFENLPMDTPIETLKRAMEYNQMRIKIQLELNRVV